MERERRRGERRRRSHNNSIVSLSQILRSRTHLLRDPAAYSSQLFAIFKSFSCVGVCVGVCVCVAVCDTDRRKGEMEREREREEKENPG